MANNNNIKITYIPFGNGLPDFRIISQYNRVIYIANITHKTRFVLLVKILIAQFYNFLNLKVDGLENCSINYL